MISFMSSAVSAINAFEKRMGVTSNNVANSQSYGFKKSRADLEEGENGAVEVEISQVNTPGPLVTVEESGTPVIQETSNVDLSEEIPQAVLTQRGFEANLKVLKTEDEVLGSLLDIFG